MAQRDRLTSNSYPYLAVQVDIRGHRFEGSGFVLGRGVIDRFKVTLDHGTDVILEP